MEFSSWELDFYQHLQLPQDFSFKEVNLKEGVISDQAAKNLKSFNKLDDAPFFRNLSNGYKKYKTLSKNENVAKAQKLLKFFGKEALPLNSKELLTSAKWHM
jgi:hypothetical protein